MPASGEAFGEKHPSTKDEYINEAGQCIVRNTIVVPERGQLSGEAFGDDDSKGFVRPPTREPEGSHDYGPDN